MWFELRARGRMGMGHVPTGAVRQRVKVMTFRDVNIEELEPTSQI